MFKMSCMYLQLKYFKSQRLRYLRVVKNRGTWNNLNVVNILYTADRHDRTVIILLLAWYRPIQVILDREETLKLPKWLKWQKKRVCRNCWNVNVHLPFYADPTMTKLGIVRKQFILHNNLRSWITKQSHIEQEYIHYPLTKTYNLNFPRLGFAIFSVLVFRITMWEKLT